ncbi:2Fe-2S iron-sulfur cluster-binding protein [Halioxenophilus sp. WMMB6]|uniref:2Fe-2S iron-sulfur cluster-binding protein n=1 Tax=Halioxenophilus sp. WMMB6 TaxID=3073815 RepID=UPI00295F58B1|nr:2Fe-2S iron-sulfur cluster-binding protein [Halioxenophilus sp. WMMB6]
MPKVVYIDHQDNEYVVEVENGESLMQAALDNDVPSILGDCGGACACATCHVYVDPSWMEKAGEPSETETEMLDGLIDPQPTSRLCCQIFMSDELDGITVRLPESQF